MAIDSNARSIEERVFFTLEEDILTGKLNRGEQLREAALAARLKTSRTPIRGALHKLSEEGLVELCANKGATVIGIAPEDIEDVYEIRMRLEGLAARLAAERMSDEEKAQLESAVEISEFYLSKNSDEKYGELDSQFHSIIFRSSGVRLLCKILSELHNNIKAYRRVSLSDRERAVRSVAEHREILNAIKMGEGAEAERLTVVHLSEALKNLKNKCK